MSLNEITKAEMSIVLQLVKSPETDYNANNISKVVGITAMGALKILKRLEKESILKSKKVGKANTYRVNVDDDYACKYISLLLVREAHSAPLHIKRWITEVSKIK